MKSSILCRLKCFYSVGRGLTFACKQSKGYARKVFKRHILFVLRRSPMRPSIYLPLGHNQHSEKCFLLQRLPVILGQTSTTCWKRSNNRSHHKEEYLEARELQIDVMLIDYVMPLAHEHNVTLNTRLESGRQYQHYIAG